MSSTIARRVTVRGRVQGVWFRGSAIEQARALGVSGHARNLGDGTLEVIAVGPAPAVEAMIAWLRHGPPMARVTDVQVEDLGGDFTRRGFTAS